MQNICSEKIDTHGGSIRVYIKKDKQYQSRFKCKKNASRGRKIWN